ncbi:MAG TPA: undecaprenyl-diphosphatase UppP [Thermomicrobiales bacterium]|nr:undecaprenyl-diphosphatase UppP [Thermomicrobiales bacterium]
MELWQAIILGIVQGLTEFLPVSSSGHLIIFPWLFGWENGGLAFDASLHLGTLVAVLVYFRRDLWQMITVIPYALSKPGPILRGESGDDDRDRWAKLGLLIVIACIPGAIVGALFESRVDEFFHTDETANRAIAMIAAMLILLALVLWWAEKVGKRTKHIRGMNWVDAVVVGLGQALAAVLPGTSRSGATITAGLFRGLTRPEAARFSFLAGVPLILGAGLLSLADAISAGMDSAMAMNFLAGGVTSAIVGFITIGGLLKFLQRQSTMVFIVYRVIFGLFLFLMLFLR